MTDENPHRHAHTDDLLARKRRQIAKDQAGEKGMLYLKLLDDARDNLVKRATSTSQFYQEMVRANPIMGAYLYKRAIEQLTDEQLNDMMGSNWQEYAPHVFALNSHQDVDRLVSQIAANLGRWPSFGKISRAELYNKANRMAASSMPSAGPTEDDIVEPYPRLGAQSETPVETRRRRAEEATKAERVAARKRYAEEKKAREEYAARQERHHQDMYNEMAALGSSHDRAIADATAMHRGAIDEVERERQEGAVRRESAVSETRLQDNLLKFVKAHQKAFGRSHDAQQAALAAEEADHEIRRHDVEYPGHWQGNFEDSGEFGDAIQNYNRAVNSNESPAVARQHAEGYRKVAADALRRMTDQALWEIEDRGRTPSYRSKRLGDLMRAVAYFKREIPAESLQSHRLAMGQRKQPTQTSVPVYNMPTPDDEQEEQTRQSYGDDEQDSVGHSVRKPPESEDEGEGIGRRRGRGLRGGRVDELNTRELAHKLRVLRGIRDAGNKSPRIAKEIAQLERKAKARAR